MLQNDRPAIVGVIAPGANAAGTLTTAWVAVKNFQLFQAIVLAGTLGTGGTLDAKLQQATSAAGAGVKDITGKAITQLTQADTDSDKQAVINCAASELDTQNGFVFLRLSMTTATATSGSAAVLLGLGAGYIPGTRSDAASVDEIVG